MARNTYWEPKRRLRADLLAFGDDQQDARDTAPPIEWDDDGSTKMPLPDPSLPVMIINRQAMKIDDTGDTGGTNSGFFPLLGSVGRLVRSALSFLGVRR